MSSVESVAMPTSAAFCMMSWQGPPSSGSSETTKELLVFVGFLKELKFQHFQELHKTHQNIFFVTNN